MLDVLKIKQFAVIDETEIEFREGLNIISGETGAGKSIVIEAINLLLGGRASSEMIRAGCNEAIIEGFFDLRDISWIRPRLEQFGIEAKENVLLVKRIVHRNGKNRIYINGELSTVTILQDLTEGLIDLCGQHEHQSLLKPAVQMDLLDRYGGIGEVSQFASIWSERGNLKKKLESLQKDQDQKVKQEEFLRFQIEELESAALQPNEDEDLQKEKKLLQSAEERGRTAVSIGNALMESGDGFAVLDLIKNCVLKLKGLAQKDDYLESSLSDLEKAAVEVEEVGITLRNYADRIEFDPERFEEVQERLSLIANFKRKYGQTVAEMLSTLDSLKADLSNLSSASENAEKLSTRLSELEVILRELAEKISIKRRKFAKVFSDSVTAELRDLNLANASFQVELSEEQHLENWTEKGAANVVDFRVQTNKGEPAKPLGKTASGGELSRLMLSIRRVISDKGGIGVYLFDEIDSGIGGQTAFQVGKKLASVAKFNQVIVITHLPQVAAFADHHLTVTKEVVKGRTVTEVKSLAQRSREKELARMLGGDRVTETSIRAAHELMDMARTD